MTHKKLIPAIFDRSLFDNTKIGTLLDNSVGLDHWFDRMFEDFLPAVNSVSYPPYNIRHDSDSVRTIEMALAGYTEADLEIEIQQGNVLVVKGNKVANIDDANTKYVYQGVAARKFTRMFQLADGAEVTGANLKDGMLNVTIKIADPVMDEPKKITINS